MTQSALVEWAVSELKLISPPSQATVSNILRRRDVYEGMCQSELNNKRRRQLKHPDLDDALILWIHTCEERQVSLSYEIIREKAQVLAQKMGLDPQSLSFSNGD